MALTNLTSQEIQSLNKSLQGLHMSDRDIKRVDDLLWILNADIKARKSPLKKEA